MMKNIRTLLIEDNRLLREGISAMVSSQGDMTIVATSNGNDDFLKKIKSFKPHLILVDLGLNHRYGVRIVALLRAKFPSTKVVGMGLATSESDIIEFIEVGASGFILKEASVKDFLATIRLVANGQKVLPPLLTESLFSQVVKLALERGKRRIGGADRMTKREKEIVILIADGLSNKDIAERLHIATYTVKSHVHNILEKLTLRSRLQIARYAQDRDSS
ncbi:MAG: response regulator transcription factor [Ignavibacteriae bacterium]|nr:response regulator transcription factor [Ignavibacteriota bacterium]